MRNNLQAFDIEGLPPLLTVEQVSRLLQIHPKTVHALAKRGALPGVVTFPAMDSPIRAAKRIVRLQKAAILPLLGLQESDEAP